jgi:hypothetical protein
LFDGTKPSADRVNWEHAMTSSAGDLTDREFERRDALVVRLFEAFLGIQDLLTIYLGDRLGVYGALADQVPATFGELAARTVTPERYVR